MARWRLIVCVVVIVLAARRSDGQTGSASLQKELAGIRKMEMILGELIETKDLHKEMPFAKFLDELAHRVANKGKITLRIDRDAFGKSFDAVTQAPVRLPAIPMQTSVATALRLAVAQQKVRCVYRIDPTCVTITTPARSDGPVHTATYDIRDLVQKAPNPDKDAAALQVVQTLVASDCVANSVAAGTEPAIRLRNGHELVIRATARGHLDVIELLTALRRLADVAVIVQAQLYEVDDAFHTRLRTAKRVSLAEGERRFLAGEAPKGDLFTLLAKEKPVQVGDKAKVDNRATVALLSRYDIVTCLPSPVNARKEDNTRQAVPEGVTFTGVVEVSPDRRSVRIRFTEKAAKIEARERLKVEPLGFHHAFKENEPVPPKQIDAERVFVMESATTTVLEIPDGGSILVAVQYRPAALAAKQRWWVLSITPRIWIEEEERLIREGKTAPIP